MCPIGRRRQVERSVPEDPGGHTHQELDGAHKTAPSESGADLAEPARHGRVPRDPRCVAGNLTTRTANLKSELRRNLQTSSSELERAVARWLTSPPIDHRVVESDAIVRDVGRAAARRFRVKRPTGQLVVPLMILRCPDRDRALSAATQDGPTLNSAAAFEERTGPIRLEGRLRPINVGGQAQKGILAMFEQVRARTL